MPLLSGSLAHHGDDLWGSPGELWPEDKWEDMSTKKNELEKKKREKKPQLIYHSDILTLASLLMVQHREAEVMLWVKLEATSTEYRDGKALDSQ